MSNKALVLGATDIYPFLGSNLQSCCKDMRSMYDWYGRTFNMSGASFLSYQNARYTKASFFEGIRRLAKKAKAVGIAMSNHGTTIPVNGVNHAAMVFSDSKWSDLNSFGFDTDFAAIYNDFPTVKFYVTADACESGPLAFRLLEFDTSKGVNKNIQPPIDLEMEIQHNAANGQLTRALTPLLPNVAYISGTAGQGFYSIDEGDGGAFTKHLTKLGPMTARQYANTLDKQMDAKQQPQAHGGLADVMWMSE